MQERHGRRQRGAPLGQALEPLEGVVDEDPVLVSVAAVAADVVEVVAVVLVVLVVVVDASASASAADASASSEAGNPEVDVRELVKVGRVVDGPGKEMKIT